MKPDNFPLLKEGDIAIDETTFPDKAFREWVQNPANLNGAGSDGVLTRAEREAIKTIFVKQQQITNLKGVELFPNITYLNAEETILKKSIFREILNCSASIYATTS